MMLISIASALLTAGDRAREASMWIWPLLPITLAASALVVPCFGAIGAALVAAGGAVTGAGALLILLSASLDAPRTSGRGCAAARWRPARDGWRRSGRTPGAWLLVKVGALGVAAVAALAVLGEFSADDRRIVRKLARMTDN